MISRLVAILGMSTLLGGVITSRAAEVRLAEPQSGRETELRRDDFAQWQPTAAPNLSGGSFTFWVRPLWDVGDMGSHPILTFKWSGSDHSYFALSRGWWEPGGRAKLHLVLSNQDYLFCVMPWSFNYTQFLPGEYTMLGVSWQAGPQGYLRLYVDGKAICEHKASFDGGRVAQGNLIIGSDRGAWIDPLDRHADFVIRDLTASNRPKSADEMRTLYLQGGGDDRPKWLRALTLNRVVQPPLQERRVMYDEDPTWASSELEMQRRLQRAKAAGFNVYVPCVWDGANALWAPPGAARDRLRRFIELAHAQGIQVHPWFVVVRRPENAALAPEYSVGAAPGSYNIHTTAFRDFIVGLVEDVARRYDVDGINLDYVRAIGPCSNDACVTEYSREFGRDLAADWKAQAAGAQVPSLIAWNGRAMSDIVGRMAAIIRREKPHAVISIDTVPFDHGREHQGLDAAQWIRNGWVDSMVDMTYEDPIDIATVDRAVATFGAASQVILFRNYDIFDERIVDRSSGAMADYIRAVRARWPGAGVGFYQYLHATSEQLTGVGGGEFSQPATPVWNR